MNCPRCNGSGVASWGVLRNEELSLTANLITARAALRDLEKLARRTPPRHLVEERRRVADAAKRVDVERARIAAVEARLAELRAALAETSPSPPGVVGGGG